MENFPHTSYNIKQAVVEGDYQKAINYANSPFWQCQTLIESLTRACGTDDGGLKDMRGKKVTLEIFRDSSIYVKVYDEDEWE